MSPKTKLTGKELDYLVDCQLEFGEYVQANEDNTKTNPMNARTFPAICLGPVGNVQGSYYFLSLETWEVVKRRSWQRLPSPTCSLRRLTLRLDRRQLIIALDQLKFRIGGTESQ